MTNELSSKVRNPFRATRPRYTLGTGIYIVVRNRLDLFGVIVKNHASNITLVIARNDIQRLSGLGIYLLV